MVKNWLRKAEVKSLANLKCKQVKVIKYEGIGELARMIVVNDDG